jgi:hypothetical protein
MGSVAPLRRAPDYGTKLLQALQDHALQRVADGKEPDKAYACRLLADAIDNPTSRDIVLLAVADYLLQTLTGCLPDL